MKHKLIINLLNKKAEENNTIDLNAYELGVKDALEKIKYEDTLLWLHLTADVISDSGKFKLAERIENFIKEIES